MLSLVLAVSLASSDAGAEEPRTLVYVEPLIFIGLEAFTTGQYLYLVGGVAHQLDGIETPTSLVLEAAFMTSDDLSPSDRPERHSQAWLSFGPQFGDASSRPFEGPYLHPRATFSVMQFRNLGNGRTSERFLGLVGAQIGWQWRFSRFHLGLSAGGSIGVCSPCGGDAFGNQSILSFPSLGSGLGPVMGLDVDLLRVGVVL